MLIIETHRVYFYRFCLLSLLRLISAKVIIRMANNIKHKMVPSEVLPNSLPYFQNRNYRYEEEAKSLKALYWWNFNNFLLPSKSIIMIRLKKQFSLKNILVFTTNQLWITVWGPGNRNSTDKNCSPLWGIFCRCHQKALSLSPYKWPVHRWGITGKIEICRKYCSK